MSRAYPFGMDISLIQNLATVIGLLCNFRQERGDSAALDHRAFIEWLEYHRHEEVKRLVLNTHHLPREIDTLLRRGQQEILGKLAALDEVLAKIVAQIEGFGGVVAALAPGVEISEQAKKILTTFAESSADLMILMPHTSMGPILCFSPGCGQEIEEPRFLPDDLSALVAFGFLSQSFNSDGNPLFRLTRTGAKFASLLNGPSVEEATE